MDTKNLIEVFNTSSMEPILRDQSYESWGKLRKDRKLFDDITAALLKEKITFTEESKGWANFIGVSIAFKGKIFVTKEYEAKAREIIEKLKEAVKNKQDVV